MKKELYFYLVFIILFIISCNKTPSQSYFSEQVNMFIKLTENRTNYKLLLDLYADSIQYENIIIDEKYTTKEQLLAQRTLEWEDTLYEKSQDFSHSISIENITYSKNNAIIKGYITPFLYNNKRIDHKKFITSLYFNENGKIIQQEDWIDYPLAEIIEIYKLQKALNEGIQVHSPE